MAKMSSQGKAGNYHKTHWYFSGGKKIDIWVSLLSNSENETEEGYRSGAGVATVPLN